MKKGFLTIITIVSFLVAFFLVPKDAYALTFKVEKSTDTIKPNGEVTVYIKATDVGDKHVTNFSMNLNYDASKLDLRGVDGNGYSNVGNGNPVSITKAQPINSDGTIATVRFQAKGNAKAGDSNLSLSDVSCAYATDDKCSATPQSSMVKIAGLSNDATLSSLKIPNATLSPKFDKNTTEYTTTIQDITEITVNAIASDSNAKIMISDNYKNLQKGENEVKIGVTAEDGKTTKNYVIKVTLKLTPTPEELTKANAALKSLKVEDADEFEFTKELKKYSVTVPYKITKAKVLAEAENPNATIKIEGNTSLKVGRNTIKVVVTSEDGENKEVYTLTIMRSKQQKKVVQTCPDTTSKREWIMFSSFMFVTFSLGIVLGYYLCKKEVLRKIFNHKKEKKKEKEEEKLSDTIEIVPVKEKEKKIKKKD